MKLAGLVLSFAVLLSATAGASDADYCKALSEKYLTYVANMSLGSPTPSSIDAQAAIEQCKAGNAAAAVPVLEQKLRNARIDLPQRN